VIEEDLGYFLAVGFFQRMFFFWTFISVGMYSGKRVNDGSNSGKKATLKAILGESLGYGPALCEHIILDVGLQPNMKVEARKDILQALAASFAKI
jgi:hypothetical protein